MIVKGDYLYELNIPLPFALISLNYKNDTLEILPAYWFMHNMYALARNEWKYKDRDSRNEKYQLLEYDYLAPDSINEMFNALQLLESFTGKAWFLKNGKPKISDDECSKKGKELLQQKDALVNELEIIATGFENSKRKTIIRKVQQAYNAYTEMILYYGLAHLIKIIEEKNTQALEELTKEVSGLTRVSEWLNIGGQLMPGEDVADLKDKIKNKQINSWDELHETYAAQGGRYPAQKIQHALASLIEIEQIDPANINIEKLQHWLERSVQIASAISGKINESRKKDYINAFRKMVYGSETEMDNVLGNFDNNSFVQQQQNELCAFKERVEDIKSKFNL